MALCWLLTMRVVLCAPCCTMCWTLLCMRRHPAKADAPCVAALKELGAVLLGKSSMVELGVFCHGHNPHSGTILNPHHPSRTAGGSSSGSAAVVAAGVCPIAIGSDGGGSIRIPASYNGVTGLKPTAGRLADDQGACAFFRGAVATAFCCSQKLFCCHTLHLPGSMC